MTGVPHPVVSALIALLWMVLTSFSPGQLLLGLLVGLIAGAAYGRLTPDRVRLRRPRLMLQLAGRVAVDILRSNIAVARLILSDGRHGRRQRVSHGGMIVPLAD